MVRTRGMAAVEPAAAAAEPKRRRGRPPSTPATDCPVEKPTAEKQDYEKQREQRIKENMERMHKLGLLSLSKSLESAVASQKAAKRAQRLLAAAAAGSSERQVVMLPSRRSARLQNASPVSYVEVRVKKEKDPHEIGNLIYEGERDEVYTEEHEKLLGTCKEPWVLFVDGYDKNGKRVYDQAIGKTCHQCRQKTLGHRTHCVRCNIVQGQFCGDCLYMRYGENVLETKKNPDWICPVCRGICNCSICRVKKGWNPTGILYKKIVGLGYKSVAHYLIQTRRSPSASASEVKAEVVPASSGDPDTSETEAPSNVEGSVTTESESSQPESSKDMHECKQFRSSDRQTPISNGCGSSQNRGSKKRNALAAEISADCIASRLRSKRRT